MQIQTGGKQTNKIRVSKIVGIDGACFRVEMIEPDLGQVLMPVDQFKSACKDAPKLWTEYVKQTDAESDDLFVSDERDKKPNKLGDEHQEEIESVAEDRTRKAAGKRTRSKRLRQQVRKFSYKE